MGAVPRMRIVITLAAFCLTNGFLISVVKVWIILPTNVFFRASSFFAPSMGGGGRLLAAESSPPAVAPFSRGEPRELSPSSEPLANSSE